MTIRSLLESQPADKATVSLSSINNARETDVELTVTYVDASFTVRVIGPDED
jgi:hypothetical protein